MPPSIHEAKTDPPPPGDEDDDPILSALDDCANAIEELNEGIDEVSGSLRGIHRLVGDSEKNVIGHIAALSAKVEGYSAKVDGYIREQQRISRDVERHKIEIAELRRGAGNGAR